MLKKLPIGIQSIREVIEGGYVYVDKTKFALQLIESGKYYFMARPRRFGKSLFVSTLEQILGGNRKLFENYSIGTSNYDWAQHPVIHLDFTKIPTHSAKLLKCGLFETLDKIAFSYGVHLNGSSLQLRLTDLVEQLAQKDKVAVLIDEYDKPIIDNLMHPEVADTNRDLLRSFFGTLKGLDQHLKFVFVTGVSKFSQVSLFSGFNNLDDLTIDTEYATLMGYTKDELELYFDGHISQIAKDRGSKKTILDEIKLWYNGYRFSESSALVYNPFSTLSFLSKGKFKSYWFRTGTPHFLIDQIRKVPESSIQLSGCLATESELIDHQTPDYIDLKALMWQTGYLTICDYDPKTEIYQLDFPNKEVRKAFFDSLLKEFARVSPSGVVKHAQECLQNLANYDFQAFFASMQTHFAKVPYNLSTGAKEGFYHAVFLSLLEGMGIKTRAEEQTNVGRVDLVFELENALYIFEFKVNKSAQIAFDQTQAKYYQQRYSKTGKNIVVLGVNFCTDMRNISDWKGQLFDPTGKTLNTFSSSG